MSNDSEAVEDFVNDSISFRLSEIFHQFRNIHDPLTEFYKPFSLVLVIAGFLGSFMGLLIMCFNRSMKTPSFKYHKCLIAADFVFCCNFLIVGIVDSTKVDDVNLARQFHFRNPFAAYYSGVISRVVASTCGYMNLYLTLWIALDRFLALHKPVFYYGFNRSVVCRTFITVSIFLSFLLHSWSPWFERRLSSTLEGNETIYVWQPVLTSGTTERLIKTKETYNAALRISFPIILSLLTFVAIWHFLNIHKKRRKICLSRIYNGRQRRREKLLFVLMISVVFLAFIQVIPREFNRFLNFKYPSTYLRSQVFNSEISTEDRLWYFRVQLYGHEFLKVLMNGCTTINRCSLFYLYLALNPTFRVAFIQCLRKTFHIRTAEEPSLFVSANRQKPNETRQHSGIERRDCSPLIVENQEERLETVVHLSPWDFLRRLSPVPRRNRNREPLQTPMNLEDNKCLELQLLSDRSTLTGFPPAKDIHFP